MTFDYRKTALSRLTGQFEGRPRLCGLVETMVQPLQEIEADLSDLNLKRWVNSAEGKQLDYCGYIVGLERFSVNDEEYRTAIKARILSNVSGATAGALIEGVKFLTKAKQPQYLESYPACAILFTDGDAVPTGAQRVIQDIAPAAIETVPLLVNYGRQRPVRLGTLTASSVMSASADSNEPAPLTVGNSLLSMSSDQPIGGTGLAGTAVTKTKITANRRGIRAGQGLLSVGTYQVHDNGYHLTGAFQ